MILEFYLVFGSLILALVVLSFMINIGRRGYTHDHRRIIEMGQLSTALELYFQEHGTYPIVSPGCQDIFALDEFLSPTFMKQVPRSVLETAGTHELAGYQYAVSNDGHKYVLKVTLEKKNKALEQDLDGVILDCDCDDLSYCATSP